MKTHITISLFLAAFLFIAYSGCHRDIREYVAEVDGHKIAADEFKDRYKAYLTNTSARDNIVLRKQILSNMINEVLVFEDIKRQGLDADAVYRKRLEEIRLQALLDGYAKRISIDTMSVNDQELWKEFRAFNTKASARYLYAKTEDGAWKLKERLQHGETFEALAREVFEDPGLANNGGSLGSFGWGEMEPALEEAAFSLPIGQVSDPITLNIGYAVVKVESRLEQPLASEYDYAKIKEKLSRAIQERKVIRLVKDATHRISTDLVPSFNEQAVDEVFRNWHSMSEEPRNPGQAEHRQQLSDDLRAMHFATFQDRAWSVGEFLAKLNATTSRQKKRVHTPNDLKDVAIGLATREILVEKARQAGLEEDPGVLAQIKKVSQEYQLKKWASSVQDTVGQHGWDERLLREGFERNKSQFVIAPQMNIAEILVRTEPEAAVLMGKLKRGADFAQLARTNSIRLWAAKRGGELGFGTKATYGILGEKFSGARVDQVIGPERVDPYYGIFKILERKKGRPKSFEESREELIKGIANNRKQEVLKQAINTLRSGAKISIDMKVLEFIGL